MKLTRFLRSKAPFLLTLLALIVVVRGAVRQRRLFRALAALMFAYPGEDAVNAVAGFFTDVAGRVRDFVFAAIAAAISPVIDLVAWCVDQINAVGDVINWSVQHALDFVQTLIDALSAGLQWSIGHVYDALLTVIGDVRDGILAVIGAVRDGLEWSIAHAVDVLTGLIDGVASAAQSALDAAVGGLEALVGEVRDGIIAVVGSVRDGILAVVGGVRDVLDAAIHDLWSALDAVAGPILDAARALIDAALAGLHSITDAIWSFVYDHVVGPLEDLGSYVWEHAKPLLDVVEACLDWLIWLATLPFQVAFDLWHGLRDLSLRDVLDNATGSHARNRGTLDVVNRQVNG